jgi:uridine kinase
VYNFAIHGREPQTKRIEPAQLIIVEGILLFAAEEVRDLFDLKIFVDTDSDTRVLRRIERDIRERGRDFVGVQSQYLETVKPMHDAFVEPSKKYADVIIPEGGHNAKALNLILSRLKELSEE